MKNAITQQLLLITATPQQAMCFIIIYFFTSSPPGKFTEESSKTESSFEKVSTFHLFCPTFIKKFRNYWLSLKLTHHILYLNAI